MHQQLIDLIYYEYLFDCERNNPEYIKERYSHLYPKIDKFKIKCWYNENNQLHREGEDGNRKPARILENGYKWWYNEVGQLRREGEDSNGNRKPSVIYANGDKFWFMNGELQRIIRTNF